MILFAGFVGYEIGTNLGCTSFKSLRGSRSTLNDAFKRCNALSRCKAVRDWRCRGNNYFLCKSIYKSSSTQECLYVKGNSCH